MPTDGPSITDETTKGDHPLRLRWRLGPFGCLFPLWVGAVMLFGHGGFDASQRAELADGYRSGWLAAAEPLTAYGVNPLFLGIAAYLAWELFRYGQKWVDEYALIATASAIHIQGPKRRAPIPWREVREVRFYQLHRQWTNVPVVEVVTTAGTRHRLVAVENDNGEAVEFAKLAQERIKEHRLKGGSSQTAPFSDVPSDQTKT